jgi:hypothetical protein
MARETMADVTDYPCPACGFLTFNAPPGSFDICVVCGWEDDHVQLAYPLMRGGANRESLVEAQAAALARHPLQIQNMIVPAAGRIDRDAEWRPLTREQAESLGPRTGLDYFHAAVADAPPYYWRARKP